MVNTLRLLVGAQTLGRLCSQLIDVNLLTSTIPLDVWSEWVPLFSFPLL